MDAFSRMSIKNFAKFTGVTQSTLRFYDEIGLLSPAERGEENNYRYYTPIQSKTLHFINVLTDLGVKLEDIKEMAKNRSPESVMELLSKQEVILDYNLYKLRTAYSIVHTLRTNIQSGIFAVDDTVKVEMLDDAHFILGPENDYTDVETYYKPFMAFTEAALEYRVNLRFPIGGYHYDMESFLAGANKPDKFFSLDPLGNCVSGAGKYLAGYKRGYYGELGDIPQRMAAYAKEHSLVCEGPVYTLYLLDEICETEPTQYLGRAYVKIRDERHADRERMLSEAFANCPAKKTCARPHCNVCELRADQQ
ncbi:MAG: MerR family transcriptional regulator [Oscillospiraceae bacterium]|jgi:DNA-binding transcriptional MerR regulator|nr:MerR family transcriptional regulator [Oscillospiraceae bacterium]